MADVVYDEEWARNNLPEGVKAETQEEYAERVAAARTAGIFGDTDTTAGAGANQTDVPTADNEAATVAVAAVDAAQEDDDDEVEDVSDAEARRQTSADASVTEPGDVIGTTQTPEETAEEEEPAPAEPAPAEPTEPPSDEAPAEPTERLRAEDVIADVEKAESVEEVDRLVEGDQRVTVKRAADKRRQALAQS